MNTIRVVDEEERVGWHEPGCPVVMNVRGLVLALLLAAFLFPLGCAPPSVLPPRRDIPPLARVSIPEVLVDDMDRSSLNLAVDTSIRFYERNGGKGKYCFGDRCFTDLEMAAALRRFREIVNNGRDAAEQMALIRESFDFYRAAGRTGRGDVLVTGYFEPVLEGALERTGQFRYPLYKTPEETVTVRLGLFQERFMERTPGGRVEGRGGRSHL
jgi:membrane-bound lytic murein transglycosylase A